MAKDYSLESVFRDWNETASVRCRPKRVLTPEHLNDKYFFPPESTQILMHPLLSNIGDDKKREVLIHQLYTYLNFTQYLEHEAICVVSYKISMGKYKFDMPHMFRASARKIYVDEIYHWMFSIDFAEEIEVLTGVKNLEECEPHFLRTLRDITEGLTTEQQELALLFFTTIAETLITPTMGKFPKDERLVVPVRELIGDHSADELRHLRYFIDLFHFIWEQIDPVDKHTLCLLLPKMIYGYFEPDFYRITQLLMLMGYTNEDIQKIISETYPRNKVMENIMASSAATMKLFRDVGMFEDQEVKCAFQQDGFNL